MANRPENNRDAEHLDRLSLFYYILGGIDAVVLVVAGIGPLNFSGAFPGLQESLGRSYALLVLVFFLACALTICVFLSAYFLKSCRYRTFSLAVAAVICLNVPLGTVLGIFTIVVLMRPSVKIIYIAELDYGSDSDPFM